MSAAAVIVGSLALYVACAALWLSATLTRRDLQYNAAFWRRMATRAAWQGDKAAEAFAERQYRACLDRLTEMDGGRDV